MADWIDKYNIPVPRYTSYPPANLFNEEYGASELRADIERSNKVGARAVSYYIHVPYCRSICHFCACNKVLMPQSEPEVSQYFSFLQREIKLTQELLDPERPIAQIHFGGGSPTSVPLHYITEIVEQLTEGYQLQPNAEIAIEAHPGYLNMEQWQMLIDHRFTRFSIGIQDFDETVLKTAHRAPSVEDISEVVKRIQGAGKRVNLDFIYGLPQQSVDGFLRSIERAIEVRPNRLVTFSYAHVPWLYPAQKLLEKKGLPSVGDKKEMYDKAANLMLSAGYVQVGLDHFVLPDDPLAIAMREHTLHRNFQGYCPRELSGQVYALGITGISQLYDSYAQSVKEVAPYYQALEEGKLPTRIGYKLSLEECLARDIITDLMCNYRTDTKAHADNYGIPIERIVQRDRLDQMIADGLVTEDSGILTMNQEAHLFVRNVASTFDLHYNPQQPKGYSKPI